MNRLRQATMLSRQAVQINYLHCNYHPTLLPPPETTTTTQPIRQILCIPCSNNGDPDKPNTPGRPRIPSVIVGQPYIPHQT
jgi:hypothetical protein